MAAQPIGPAPGDSGFRPGSRRPSPEFLSSLLRLRLTALGWPGTLRLGLAAGLGSGLRADALGQLGTSGLAIPLFIGLRRDLAHDQQLCKLPALRLALEWHLASAAALRPGWSGTPGYSDGRAAVGGTHSPHREEDPEFEPNHVAS